MFSGTMKKRKNSVILSVFFIGLICYLFFTWFGLQGKIKEQTQTIAIVSDKIKVQNFENTELQRILDSGNKSDYVEHVARSDLGYVMPGERIYYDISAGK